MARRRRIIMVGVGGFLILFAILYLIPYVWMISMSFKPDSEIYSRSLFPQAPTLEQYQRLFFGYQFQNIVLKIDYPRFYLNTILMMLPIYATLIPSFWLFSKLDLVNRYEALILPGVIDAYGIFLLKQYMETVPDDLLDAAKVDGAGAFRRFWQIVVPLSRPALGTLAIFRFLGVWNDYLWPLVIIRDQDMYTLTLGIASMEIRQGLVVWGSQMAAAVLATIPVVILVLIAQRQFLRGLTVGAFKG